MNLRSATVLLFLSSLACGCSTLGTAEVQVETGNQPTGFLSRPMVLTTASDDSVRQVAQRICDNVKPGSEANITFVGKVPGPGPINVADWGRYRYDCEEVLRPARHAPAPATATVPTAPRAAPAIASPSTSANPAATSGSDVAEQHRRDCQRQQGSYQICLGSCLLGSGSPAGAVEAECGQRCASLAPVGCN